MSFFHVKEAKTLHVNEESTFLQVGVHETVCVYGKAQVIIREVQWKYFMMYDEVRHLSPSGSHSAVNMQAPFFPVIQGKRSEQAQYCTQ